MAEEGGGAWEVPVPEWGSSSEDEVSFVACDGECLVHEEEDGAEAAVTLTALGVAIEGAVSEGVELSQAAVAAEAIVRSASWNHTGNPPSWAPGRTVALQEGGPHPAALRLCMVAAVHAAGAEDQEAAEAELVRALREALRAAELLAVDSVAVEVVATAGCPLPLLPAPTPLGADDWAPSTAHRLVDAFRAAGLLISGDTPVLTPSQLDGARAEAEERAQLVARLEADLEHASASGAQPVNPAEALAEVVGTAAAESAGPGSSAEDLLRIVAGQRDRYRAAQAKAEEELSSAQAALAKSAGALETAQADNVTLYEKIRYLESYSAQQLRQLAKLGGSVPPPVKVDDAGVPVRTPSAAAARYSCGPVSVSVGEDADDGGDAIGGRPGAGGLTRRGLRYQCFGVGDEEEGQPQQGTERYRREYEQRLNPFERFKHREAAAGIANLGASDRAVLAGGQLLAGSKMARAFVAVYAALLHAFVFFTLYVAAN
mmetsp:Transcript_10647/g.27386  ORF Transcript_10647/g.27386 Transcript_10647/m.27386 type:complete len:487 (-) Transcript_10647:243-1703(-)